MKERYLRRDQMDKHSELGELVSPLERRKLEAAQRGDRYALEELLEPHRDRIQRYFQRRVQSEEDARTLVQRTFLSAINAIPSFRGDCPFDRWLWRIAAHECIRYYKGRKRDSTAVSYEEIGADNLEPAQQDSDEESLNQSENRIWLENILKAMREVCSPNEYRVMAMFYQCGSLEEVASLLDMKPATVRSHFLRGRAQLLAFLIRYMPDSVGGNDLIHSIVRQLRGDSNPDRLDDQEFEAVSSPDRHPKAYRSACVKIARCLPNPLG